MGTVFIVHSDLPYGFISGKYFCFYLSIGIVAITTVLSMKNARANINIADCLILLFGITTLTVSYFIHSSEATTKHILLSLILLLYFYFKTVFIQHKSARYWLNLFFLLTG
ncbi:MAG: hypothetical protein LBH04_10470, partial [Tannerellaceae bacterium]|nr:hypothetical protein [Tannerellaceae bacterium]